MACVTHLTFWEKLILDKRRYLTSLSAIVAGVSILIIYSQSGPSHDTYLEAEAAYEKWVSSPDDALLFNSMQESLKRVPQLSSKYNAVIAQTLLDRSQNRSDSEKAIGMALKSMNSIQQEAPFHASYSENSLCIEMGSYQEALQNAVALKEEMDKVFDLNRIKEEPFVGGSVLYVHNLIRIASLQQKLSNRPGEKAAWDEVEKFLSRSGLEINCFHEKEITLSHYISGRKKHF